jgi:hypothetical protein
LGGEFGGGGLRHGVVVVRVFLEDRGKRVSGERKAGFWRAQSLEVAR